MNNKAVTFIRNFSYTLSSNLISMIISTIIILIVPKLIGVEEYGFWQLYLFYASYVGILHFGWSDGIYLRFGGKEYKELNKGLFFSQFWMLVITQLFIGTIILFFSTVFSTDINKLFIVEMTIICMFIVNIRLVLIYILQCTNRIKEFAQITLIEKILYAFFILLFLLMGVRNYEQLIVADIIGKFISLVLSIYYCRDIVFRKINEFVFTFRETFLNINSGIKLLFANLASMLIVGIVRLGVERSWDVSTFGKVSLTLTISNLMMLFTNALSMVLFPVLRRTTKQELPRIYTTMRTLLMVPLLGLIIGYYPLNVLLTKWLPQFADSIMYMALLFPMCIYEGKMSMLINTYYKTLRKENLLLSINLITVILSIIFTALFTLFYKNLLLAILTILVLLAFRCILAEIILSRVLNITVYKEIFLEMIMTFIFILTGWFVNLWIGAVIYIAFYCLYLLTNKRDIKVTLNNIKHLISV